MKMVFKKKRYSDHCPDCKTVVEAASERSLACNLKKHRDSWCPSIRG